MVLLFIVCDSIMINCDSFVCSLGLFSSLFVPNIPIEVVFNRGPRAQSMGSTRSRCGARGGLGGYSPPTEHASPRLKVKSDFFRRFLAFIVP